MWRTGFGLGIGVLLFIIFWRVYKLRESAVWKADKRAGGNRSRNLGLLFKMFWPRCILLSNSACLCSIHFCSKCCRSAPASNWAPCPRLMGPVWPWQVHEGVVHVAAFCAACMQTHLAFDRNSMVYNI